MCVNVHVCVCMYDNVCVYVCHTHLVIGSQERLFALQLTFQSQAFTSQDQYTQSPLYIRTSTQESILYLAGPLLLTSSVVPSHTASSVFTT